MIPDPKSFFTQLGGLHDARIRQIRWDAAARTISLEVGDLNAKALELPKHMGSNPGTLIFHDAEGLTFACDAFSNDIQRVHDVEIDETGSGRYRCTLLVSPSGRLTFDFSAVALAAVRPQVKAEGSQSTGTA